MFVRPDFRKRGVGGALLRALLAHARNTMGLAAAALEVAGTQEPARQLYLSCGFRPAGEGARGGEEMLLAFASGPPGPLPGNDQ